MSNYPYINFETLLRKYIRHVGETEGSDFLGYLNPPKHSGFTDDEWKILNDIGKSVWDR